MLIDSRKGNYGWTMWHCELCRNIANIVQWVDTDLAQYGEYRSCMPLPLQVETIQARKIICYPDRRLLLVNPFDDNSDYEEVVYGANISLKTR